MSERQSPEERRAQEALRVKESAIAVSINGMALAALDGTLTYVNRSFLEMWGCGEERDAVGRSATEFWASPDDALTVMHAVLDTGRWNGELTARRRDGATFPVRLAASLVRSEAGSPLCLAATFIDISEQKRTEAARRASEEHLRTIMESAPATILEVDRGGIITFINRPTPGLTVGQVVGSSIHQWVPQERRPVVARALEQAFTTGLRQEYESEGPGPDGTTRIYAVRLMPLLVAGEASSAIYIATDITERTRAVEALRKSERMLHAIIDTEPDCIKVLDAELRLVMMNRAGLAMIQADSLEQVKGQVVCPLVAPAHRDAFADLARRVFQGQSGGLEFQMTGLRGRQLWLETQAVPLRDESDQIVGLLGVTRDISERKRSETALQESEERFRTLAESLPLAVFELDRQGRFTYVNQAALSQFGYTPPEVENGLTMSQMLAPKDRARAREAMGRRLEGLQREQIEYLALRRDGTTFPITVASSPIMRDGRPVGLRGIVVDLSERRELEAERLRTQKLESIGTLAGGIAHDFNNLLQGVFGYIALAKNSLGERERAAAMLAEAEQALHTTVRLTSQLLTFAKGGAPVKRSLHLRPVVENAVKLALSGSRVGYRLTAEAELQPVDADEGQLAQVVQNVALNAEQAMPGGGTVAVDLRNVRAPGAGVPADLAPGAYVRVAITDTGVGIPEQHLARIFDPYFTTKQRGSGLGLATSYSIVRGHGGALRVRSAPGEGSTFTIYLPAANAPPPAAGVAVGTASPPPPPRAARILVMDDEELVCAVTGGMLAALGHEAVSAPNGESAVEQYRQALAAGQPFDLVILDLTVRGGMGGIEALRQMRELAPAVKAVVSSGYSDDAAFANHAALGFRRFLRKPYNIGQLQEVLAELLA